MELFSLPLIILVLAIVFVTQAVKVVPQQSAWVLERWGMPEYLVQATRFSHALSGEQLAPAGDNVLFCACTTLAGWLAEVWLNAPDEPATARIGQRAQAQVGERVVDIGLLEHRVAETRLLVACMPRAHRDSRGCGQLVAQLAKHGMGPGAGALDVGLRRG